MSFRRTVSMVSALICLLACATGLRGDGAPASGASGRAWKLPGAQHILRTSLRVSADRRFILYAVSEPSEKDPQGAVQKYFVLDTRTAKATAVLSLLDARQRAKLDVGAVEFSHSRNLLMVCGRQEKDLVNFVVDLESGKSLTLPKFTGAIVWGGSNVIESIIGKNIEPVKVTDPLTDKSFSLPLRALVLTASSDWQVLLAACVPDHPDQELDRDEFFKNAKLALVDAKGKVLRVCGAVDSVTQQPVLSPKGKFAGFQIGPSKPGQQFTVQVFPSDPKGKVRSIKEYALVIGLTDQGEIVTIDAGMKGTVKYWDAQGAGRVLVEQAVAATLSGNRLYYVSLEGGGTIRVMDLPEGAGEK